MARIAKYPQISNYARTSESSMALDFRSMGSKIEGRTAGLREELFIQQGSGMMNPE
jgi:hypothetical protein